MRAECRAVMLTDMTGFTAATLRQTRGENARMLALHDALLLPVVKAFGGLRVKTIGDAYLVIFRAATEAVLCGMAIQDRLWDYNRRAPGAERMEVRVAVSFGEVRLVKAPAGVDVFGDAVNLAARVEGEALPGDVWLTEAVYQVADRGSLPLEEIGPRALKGLPEEVCLFRVARGGHEAEGARRDGRSTPGANDRGRGPPYGNAALALVRWLPPPRPEYLARPRDAARPTSRWRTRLLARALAAALLLSLAAGAAGAAALWFRLPRPERLVRRGRYAEARAAVGLLAEQKGSEAPEVLFLRGRVEAASADAGRGGSVRAAFQLWSRGLALGSEDALEALEREARAGACERRRLATRALADARSRRAANALERLSAAEPARSEERPAPSGAAPRQRPERCGTGDIARQALRAREGE